MFTKPNVSACQKSYHLSKIIRAYGRSRKIIRSIKYSFIFLRKKYLIKKILFGSKQSEKEDLCFLEFVS